MFKKEFIDLVNKATEQSNNFYNIEINKNQPNPNFLGFGNPNSQILILGKEKGFNITDIEKLQNESINNPTEWQTHIDNDYLLNFDNFKEVLKTGYINSFFPYSERIPRAGHTWNKYQKLINGLVDNHDQNEVYNNFFFHSFISEVNPNPSPTSKIRQFNSELEGYIDRINLLKSDFYSNFKVKILACGDYLNEQQIVDIFHLKVYKKEINQDFKSKLEVYYYNDKILVHTRQLSMNIFDAYLQKVCDIIKTYAAKIV